MSAETTEDLFELETLVKAFLTKYDAAELKMNGVFAFALLHGYKYTGPFYGEELKALKEFLE